jgi:hypothetical protein
MDAPTIRVVSTKETSDSASNGGRLWIHVSSWEEGMSSFMISMSEMLYIAKKLNAKLVEPCIENGYLISCSEKHNVRFSDIFNVSLVKQYHPDFVTHEEFQQFLSSRGDVPYSKICMYSWLEPEKICKGVPVDALKTSSVGLEKAVTAADQGDSVLEVVWYWKNSFQNMVLFNNTSDRLVDAVATDGIKYKYLRFTDNLYEQADEMLLKMGIPEGSNFATIQWRAEIPNLDYILCANGLIRAKRALNANGNTSFVLMSSINANEELQWDGTTNLSRNSTSQQALKNLMDKGYQKLDSVINKTEVKDMVILSALDLIIATKANTFVTCRKNCRQNSYWEPFYGFCRKCNYLNSNFAALAMNLRKQVNKTTRSCWPGSVPTL